MCQSSNIPDQVIAKSSESILSALGWRETISRSEHYRAESNDYFVYPRPDMYSLRYSLNGADSRNKDRFTAKIKIKRQDTDYVRIINSIN